MIKTLTSLLVLAFVVPSALGAETYTPRPGPHPVVKYDVVWNDGARSRDVPVRIYYPAGERAPKTSPVIVFSHGLGGSREMYGYLGEGWAAQGFISVHVQHLGSDVGIFRDGRAPREVAKAMKGALSDSQNLVNRPKDVTFVLDRLTALNEDEGFVLRGKLDLKRIAVAGHSFGAYTVMALCGQTYGPPDKSRTMGADERIVAAVAMSSQPAPEAARTTAYALVKVPIFHLTGTHDESVAPGTRGADDGRIGNTSAAGRRVAYDHTENAHAFLLTFQDGDHSLFSGREVKSESRVRKALGSGANPELSAEQREQMHQLILDGTIAFWEATLRGNEAAKTWFEQGGFAQAVGSLGKFEQKSPAKRRAGE